MKMKKVILLIFLMNAFPVFAQLSSVFDDSMESNSTSYPKRANVFLDSETDEFYEVEPEANEEEKVVIPIEEFPGAPGEGDAVSINQFSTLLFILGIVFVLSLPLKNRLNLK